MDSAIVSDFSDFYFDKLTLAQPHAIQGGTYFTKLAHMHNPLYVQTPKSLTKQGIAKTEHKTYTDLLFTQSDNAFINWLEGLENRLHELIYEKRTSWFHNDLEMSDIENAFTCPVRTFRSGKNYLVRCHLGKTNTADLKQGIKIFNEAEKDIRLDDIRADNSVITILEITGIRFSTRSFHIDLHIKQLMVFQSESPFKSCLIKQTTTQRKSDVPAPADTADESVSSLSDIDDADESESVDNGGLADDHPAQEPTSEPSGIVPCDSVTQPVGKTADDAAADNAAVAGGAAADDSVETATDVEGLGAARVSSSDPGKTLDKTLPVAVEQKNTKDLEEVELDIDSLDEEIQLKDPNEVYMQIYMDARQKAKLAKKVAIEAYLEAKKIKNTYLLEEIDESDEEEMFNFSEK